MKKPTRRQSLIAAGSAVALVAAGVIGANINNGPSSTTLTGMLKVAVAMGDVPIQATIDTPTGPVALDVTDNAQPSVLALAGQDVHAAGTKQKTGDLTTTKVTAATAQSPAPTATAPKPINVALVLMEATGTTFFGSGSQPWTPAYMQSQVLGPALAYFTTVSGGQVHATGRMFGTVQSTLSPADCSIADWTNAGAAAVAQQDPTGVYTQVAVIANVVSCPFAGIAYVGSSGVLLAVASSSTLVHELGHNFGFWHSGSYSNATPSVLWDYGDPTDVMGSGTSAVYSAYHQNIAGWLPAPDVDTVAAAGTTTVTLTSIESNQLTPGITQLVRVGNLAIDLRDGTGYDASIVAPGYYDLRGVQVYQIGYVNTDDEVVPQGLPGGYNHPSLLPGQSFSSGDVTVTTVSAAPGATTATVQVCVGTCGSPPPSTTTTSSAPTASTTTTSRPATTTTTVGGKPAPILSAVTQADGSIKVFWSSPTTFARTSIQIARGPDPKHVNGIGTLYGTLLEQGFLIDARAPVTGTFVYIARFTTAGTATPYSAPVTVTR